MPYSSMPYPPTNEVANKELIAHMPSHPIIDNNQIMTNPHGHHHGYSSAQDAGLQVPPNSLANSNHLNSVVDSDAYSYSLTSIGAGYDQTAAGPKKRKRDLPNEEDPLAWYDQQQQQDGAQDIKLIQQSQQYDGSTNALYGPPELLQANNQLPQQQQKQSIFNNNYSYMDPNEQWTNQAAAGAHQQQISANYHYDQTANTQQQQQQNIGQLGAIGYMPETQVYDGGLPPMSQLRPNNNLPPGGYLSTDQSSFQSIDNRAAQLQHLSQQQQQQAVLEQPDLDDAINILKEHAAEPTSFGQQQMAHLAQHDPHAQSPAADVSGSMPSLSTNTVSTTSSLHDDKVGSSNIFMRQKMNSTSNLSLGKGNKRSRSSRK